MILKDYLTARSAAVDIALDRFLPKAETKPATIHEAMRYSLFAGGKRLRPILCLAAAEACGGDPEQAMPLACAVECIHTYSLIHDDLPAMDNDDLRRGRPTSHKVFGESIAILAGDALLTIAFEIAACAGERPRYPMPVLINEAELRFIHEAKTAALLTASIRLGGMSANASPEQLEALTAFGKNLGLAFQVIDDILDVTQTSEKLGKSAGKDVAAQKATYPRVLGLEASRIEAQRLTKASLDALTVFGQKAELLRGIADYLLQRDY